MFGKSYDCSYVTPYCTELYKEIIALRPKFGILTTIIQRVIKIVMTGSSSDPVEWQPFIGNNKRREFLARRMKDNQDPLKIVIVRDMVNRL